MGELSLSGQSHESQKSDEIMIETSGFDEADSWLANVWSGFRPYLVTICVDFLVSCSSWIVLFLFKGLTSLLSISGWAGNFVANIHSAGVVVAFGIFGMLFILDVYRIRKNLSK